MTDKNAFINPCDVVEKIPDFPKVCITTFSESLIKNFAENNTVKIITHLYSANGTLPVYETEYRGQKIGLFLSRVGAPACVAGLEEIIASGAEKLVLFGCCGILNQAAAEGKIIIPSSAVRDEGTSYHYLPEGKELYPDSVSTETAIHCLEKLGIPYVTGKIWTTDAIYRETKALIDARRSQGCIAVEMEYSASLAAAGFRDVPLTAFFYGADNLDADKWEMRDLTDYGIKCCDKYMAIALECGFALS